jgi:DNA-binding transcriptional ArsR family regulator
MSPALVPRKPRPSLDTVFAALSDPTRRAIIEHLNEGEASVSDLAAPFEISVAAISRHLHVLEEAGLVARRKEGRHHLARLVEGRLRSAIAWIVQYGAFWDARLDDLSAMLEETSEEAP